MLKKLKLTVKLPLVTVSVAALVAITMGAVCFLIASNGVVPLSVPLSALSAEQDQPFVWVVDPKEHKLQRRPVRIGAYGDERVPVLEGLNASDWIVAAGVQVLREGLRVRPVDRDNRNVELAAKE